MSNELADDPSGGGVSSQRKKFTTALLVVLLIVLGIELRAGIGHSMTASEFRRVAPEGVFELGRFQHDDVRGMLKLWPSETVLMDSDNEVEYQYSWFSILRPILNRPATVLYVALAKTEPPFVVRHGTEAPSAEEIEALRRHREAPPMAEDDMSGMPGGPGQSPPVERATLEEVPEASTEPEPEAAPEAASPAEPAADQ